MLRITTTIDRGRKTLELEGKLAGPWVEELERVWLGAGPDEPIRISLCAVTFIDESGQQLLERMHASGVELAAAGCMTKAIVENVRRRWQRR